MLKLLTKFKTQSLNEVRPYENNGSFVSACGESHNSDDGVHNQSWPQDVCGAQFDEMNGGTKENTPTCFITRLPNELVKAVQLPTDVPFAEAGQLGYYENKENGDRLGANLNQKRKAGLSAAEKRKWSDVRSSRSKLQGCGAGDSSSSDEEVKELFSKQQRSEHSTMGNSEEKRQYNSSRSGKIRPSDGHSRKRHRLTFSHEKIYRPSLDFEKMQQKVFWKHSSYATSRPRIVKVRSFSGHPHNFLPESSVVTFKPIQSIQAFKLTPVEEPRALAY